VVYSKLELEGDRDDFVEVARGKSSITDYSGNDSSVIRVLHKKDSKLIIKTSTSA
jgi:hypothetical protein